MINAELDRLFPEPIEVLAELGRFLVASVVTAIAQIIGKAVRGGKIFAITLMTASITPMAEMGEFVYSENIGAYFTGSPPAKVVHVNQ